MFIYFAMLSDDKDTFTSLCSSTFGSGVGNKRHPRHLFRLRSRSLKIKDTTERAAAPSPDLFRLRSRSLAPQSVQQLLRQTFSDSEVGV